MPTVNNAYTIKYFHPARLRDSFGVTIERKGTVVNIVGPRASVSKVRKYHLLPSAKMDPINTVEVEAADRETVVWACKYLLDDAEVTI